MPDTFQGIFVMPKNYKKRGCRPIPDDFLIFAPEKPQHILMKHYKASYKTISKWQKETGVAKCPPPPPPPAPRRPIPNCFADRVRNSFFNDLVTYYKTSENTIRRWLKETGLKPGRTRLSRGLDKAGRPFVARIATFASKSIYDEAADTLRKERWIVYRCTHKGVYAKSGNHWRIGNLVITSEELIERAERIRRRAA